jgi:phage gp45-like
MYEGHGTQSLQAAASGSSARFWWAVQTHQQVHALRVSNYGRYSKPTIGSAKTFIVVSLGNVSREPILCVFYIS